MSATNELSGQPVLLTAREVAELLRVSQRTVWRWGQTGHLDAVQIGPHSTRYRRAAVEALLNGDSQSNNRSEGSAR